MSVSAATSPAVVKVTAAQLSSGSRSRIENDRHMRVVGPGAPRVTDFVAYESRDKHWMVDVSAYDQTELALNSWPVDELMFLLEGELEIQDLAGNSRVYKSGDIFLMPQGFSGAWREHTSIKKIAISHVPSSNGSGKSSDGLQKGILSVSVDVLDSKTLAPMTAGEPYLSIDHARRFVESPIYRSQDGRFQVQVKRFEAMTIALKNWPIDEFMHIQRGHVKLTTPDGNKTVHGPGSSFVLPRGFSGHWEQDDTLDMITAEYGIWPEQ